MQGGGSRGRRREYCGAACRMAAMRQRKARAGFIPRAPWSEEGRAAYYERQERRNKYANPNRGEVPTFASYMQQFHPEEWAKRNAGPEIVTRSGEGKRNAGPGNRNAPRSPKRNAGPENRNARRRVDFPGGRA